MAAKLKKGDEIIVLTGKHKGQRGEIVRVMPKDSRVIVGGLNKVKRHTKPSMASNGGIEEKEAPIHISNVAFFDSKENKPTRVGFTTQKDGTKVRVAKRSGNNIEG